MIGVERLKGLPPFTALNAAALRILAAGSTARTYAAGQTVWVAGEPARGLFVLLDGSVRILRLKEGRQSVVHRVSDRGATFGEAPLFDRRGYPASAVAAEPTRCLVVEIATLQAAMRTDPTLAETLLARIGGRVRELVDRVEVMTVDKVRARLVGWLLSNRRQEGGRWIVHYGSHQQLAEDLGTVREVVTRELSRLRAAGSIATARRGRIEIVDLEALQAEVAGASG